MRNAKQTISIRSKRSRVVRGGRARPRRGCPPDTTSAVRGLSLSQVMRDARCPRLMPGIAWVHMSRSESGASSGVERYSDPHRSWIVTA